MIIESGISRTEQFGQRPVAPNTYKESRHIEERKLAKYDSEQLARHLDSFSMAAYRGHHNRRLHVDCASNPALENCVGV